jgi:hypothetical protein
MYHSAPSLEAYIDRTTIKLRLQALAHDIVVQHRETRNFEHAVAQLPTSFRSSTHRGSMARNSVTSQSSIDTSTVTSQFQRNSVRSNASIDSLRDLRETVDIKVVIGNDVTKKSTRREKRGSSVSSKRSAGETSSKHEKKRRESKDSTGIPPTRKSLIIPSQNPIVKMSSESVSELERQKAVNARLQEQIMENIRLQEELVRKLQADQLHNNEQQHVQNGQGHPQMNTYANNFAAPSSDILQSNYDDNNAMRCNLVGNAIMSTNLNAGSSMLQVPQQPMPSHGAANQFQFQQQTSQSGVNSFLLNSGALQQQQQQLQQQNLHFNSLHRVNALKNQYQLQQEQQQAATMALFGGGISQFQQNQYGTMQQQQQHLPTSSNFNNSRAMMGFVGNSNNTINGAGSIPMGLGQQANLATSSHLRQPVPNQLDDPQQQALSNQQQLQFVNSASLSNQQLSFAGSNYTPSNQYGLMNGQQQGDQQPRDSSGGEMLTLPSTQQSSPNLTLDWWK